LSVLQPVRVEADRSAGSLDPRASPFGPALTRATRPGVAEMTDNGDVIDSQRAAEYLRINVQTIRRLARDRAIPAFKVGDIWRFRKSSLDRWAEAQHTLPRRKDLLVVDDEEPVRDMVRRVLEGEGYVVTTAAGGVEALEIMGRGVPDLVVLDLKMQGMDGPTTLKEIRQEWGQIPVIILTGYPDSELMQRALQHPPITLLPKPVTPDVIIGTVKSLVASEGQ